MVPLPAHGGGRTRAGTGCKRSTPAGGRSAGRRRLRAWSAHGPTGIYRNWANLDVDGVANESPWHFGTSSQYPVLLYGAQDPGQQRGDYDWDDNGLIEVRNLRQLNAMRWDLNGDGAPTAGNASAYASAFFDHPAGMGCPTTNIDADDNDCAGYELETALDFDADGDGAGWAPIGTRSAPFNATFDAKGRSRHPGGPPPRPHRRQLGRPRRLRRHRRRQPVQPHGA